MANPSEELKKELENLKKLSKLIKKMPEPSKLKRRADAAKSAIKKCIAESQDLEEPK